MGSNCEKSKFQNDNRVLVESFTELNYLPANTENESSFQTKGFGSVLFFTYVGGNGRYIRLMDHAMAVRTVESFEQDSFLQVLRS